MIFRPPPRPARAEQSNPAAGGFPAVAYRDIMPNHRDPYIDWTVWRPKLGTVSDIALAKEIGCSRSAVTFMRRKLGITAAEHENSHHTWTPSELNILGLVPDAVAARISGVAVHTIARKRRHLGINSAHPEADNRGSTRAEPRERLMVAMVRRARKAGLTDDQIRFVFSDDKIMISRRLNAHKVISLMERRGMSGDSLARASGLSVDDVARVLRGAHPIDAIQKIAMALGCPVADISR